jgi:hypothetical protein
MFRTHTDRVAEPTVVATFAGLTEARHAIEALQRRVDGSDIALLGERAPAAADTPRTREADRRAVVGLVSITVLGVIYGAIAGVVLGAIGAALIVAFSDAPAGPTFLISILAGALLLAATWPVFTAESKIGYSDAWDLTLADVPDGPVRVGVRTHDDSERVWVESTLRAHHAVSVRESQP